MLRFCIWAGVVCGGPAPRHDFAFGWMWSVHMMCGSEYDLLIICVSTYVYLVQLPIVYAITCFTAVYSGKTLNTDTGLGLDKLCFSFNLLCFSVMLITCAYYAFKVNLSCSIIIMLQKLTNNDCKYSIIIKESKFYVIQKRGQFVLHHYRK